MGSQFDALSEGSVAIFSASYQFGKSIFECGECGNDFFNRSRYQNILKSNCQLTSWTSREPPELPELPKDNQDDGGREDGAGDGGPDGPP